MDNAYLTPFGKTKSNRTIMIKVKRGGKLEALLFEIEMIKKQNVKNKANAKCKDNG